MFFYSLFALYYVIRRQTYSHFHLSPIVGRRRQQSIYSLPHPYQEKIMKSRYVNLPKEEGCYQTTTPTKTEPDEEPEKNPVAPDEKEQKRLLDDAETLNRIHHHMFSTVFIQHFQHLRNTLKQMKHPNIVHVNSTTFSAFSSLSWIKPIDIGSGELWEKFQQEGEMW